MKMFKSRKQKKYKELQKTKSSVHWNTRIKNLVKTKNYQNPSRVRLPEIKEREWNQHLRARYKVDPINFISS